MKMLVGVIQPFIFKQNIYLFEDGVLKTQTGVMIKDVPNTIIKFAQVDDVFDVTLKGAPEFTGKIKEDLELRELTMFGRKVFNITLE